VANLTREHNAKAVQYFHGLKERIEKMSDQLLVQFRLTVELALATIEHASLYYVQREPAELGAFRWFIDAKAADGLTDMEDLWTKLIEPYGKPLCVRVGIPNVAEC
jgi:hypothetical protein